ncbi:MAG: Rubrerythrin [Phycisphaerales bacterium]|nr:Rubrerythrin [Phycisphaerales bacterium]
MQSGFEVQSRGVPPSSTPLRAGRSGRRPGLSLSPSTRERETVAENFCNPGMFGGTEPTRISPMRSFDSLSEQEILALAITSEEEDSRIYGDFAEGLKADYPATAELFHGMQQEETEHRRRLYERYREKFGEHIPLIRRQDVRGFVSRRPVWLVRPLGLDTVRKTAESMETETRRFYLRAAERATDASVRELLTDLAEAERGHVMAAENLEKKLLPPQVKQQEEEASRRLFVLQVVQPGLAGLMDGSVSTLAPLFAAAFAAARMGQTHWLPFKVGLAASLGAGISMGFAEALSDDGSLTGRGHPYVRGVVCGLMTTLGGIGHTMPYLIPNLHLATSVAIGVVVFELAAISYIRHRYMESPWVSATIQVVLGGVLVFLTGILIGSS